MGVLSDRAELVKSRAIFEKLYKDFNKRIYVSPDPLQFLYDYEHPEDREIVGLISSSLAYGRVAQILKSIEKVLSVLGPSPSEYLKSIEKKELEESFKGFVHRFTDESEIVSFLFCISELLKRGSTLESMFHSFHEGDSWETAEKFASELLACGGRDKMYLLPKPSKGSACKRLGLFLRWMVRSDEVDPGGWTKISPDSLFIPLDTHMFNICSRLGLCSQKQANARAVKEITEAFKVISADDPVRYDFSLTRFGIRSDMQLEELFKKWESKS